MNLASSKRQWPLGRGFERYYGFLGGETNQWYPDLVYDNHPVEQPTAPRTATTSRSTSPTRRSSSSRTRRRSRRTSRSSSTTAPARPTPRTTRRRSGPTGTRASSTWATRPTASWCSSGRRARDHARGRRAVADQPVRRDDEPRRQAVVGARHACGRGTRSPTTRRSCSAAWPRSTPASSATPTTSSGGCSTTSRQTGQLDNTIIVLVSDNGASGEGGPNGSVNENKFFNGLPDTIEENLKYLDELGGPRTYNHYPTGWAWAFNTPFKMWKRYSNYEGGTADPLIVSWPAGIAAKGEMRHQYTHAIDIVPTVYECLGVELPDVVNGYTQKPAGGRELRAPPSTTPTRRRRRRRSSTRCSAPARSGTRAGRRRRGRPRRPVVGRLPPAALGAVRHRERPERVPRPRRPSTRTSSRS